MKMTVSLLMFLGSIYGCAGSSLKTSYLNAHPDLPQEMKSEILKGNLVVGMTAEQVEAAWGPAQNRETVLARGNPYNRWFWTQMLQPSRFNLQNQYGQLHGYDGWLGGGGPAPTASELRQVLRYAWVRDNRLVAWESGWKGSKETWVRGGDLDQVYERKPLMEKLESR